MLNIVDQVIIPRKTLLQKLRFCSSYKATKDSYDSLYGEINIYTLYTYKNSPALYKKLISLINGNFYTSQSKVYEDYRKKLLCRNALDSFESGSAKTVYISFLPDEEELYSLCKKAKTVYIPYCGKDFSHMLKEIGTAPVYIDGFVNADIYINENMPPKLSSDGILKDICPDNMSHLLFASLIYKENGYFIY